MPRPVRRALPLVFLAIVPACGGDALSPPPAPPAPVVTSVEVVPASARVPVPGSVTLTATVKDQRGATMSGVQVSWTSNNPGVATVDGAGVVSVVGIGEATITAAASGRSGTAQVSGLAPVAAITLAPDSLVLAAGDTVTLRPKLEDAHGNVLTERTIAWTSSATSIATVSAAGLVTAVSSGRADLTATVEGRSAVVRAFVGRAPDQLPAPRCTNCLEIVPASMLLTEPGATQLLQAFRVDAAGNRTLVRPTWQTSNAAAVTVSPDGLVAAVTGSGSARITATEGGLTSAPALAILASPVAGAVLVSDAQVVGDPVAVDATTPLGAGFRYRVRLRIAPAVGQIVLASEQAPIAGRVESVAPGPNGTSDVVLQLVPVSGLVRALQIHEAIPLPGTAVSGQPGPSFLRRGPARVAAADDPGIPVGPFTCKASTSFNSALLELSGTVTVTPSLALTLVATGTAVERLTVDGSVAVTGTVKARVPSALRETVDCKWEIAALPVPITGWLAAIITPEVPMGVGFKGVIDVGVGDVGADFELAGSADLSIGFVCTGATCPLGGSANLNLTPNVKPVVPNLSGSVKLDVTQSAFVFAELAMAPRLLPAALKVKLIEARAGVEQKMSLASMAFQQADPGYASSFRIAPKVSIKGGASLEALGGLLAVSFDAFEYEPELPTLARTPGGTFAITPRVAAGTAQTLGETATFTVVLDPVTFLGSYVVEAVELRWLRDDGTGTLTLQNARPGCTTMLPTGTGQDLFSCETDFPEADAGPQAFYAFARVRLGGVTLPVPLEIAADARAVVEVERVIVQIAPKPVTVAPNGQQAFQALVSGTANTAVTWTATGGTISATGVYTAGNATGNFQVIARSVAFPDKADTARVTISGTALVLTGTLPNGLTGNSYTGSLGASGGAGPGSYQFVSVTGRPPGLSIGASSGSVSGTPTQAGQFQWTIEVRSGGQTARRTFPVTISAPGAGDPMLEPGDKPSRWVMNIFNANTGRADFPFELAKGTLGPNRYQMLFPGSFTCFILLPDATRPNTFTGSCSVGPFIQQNISGSIGPQDGSGFMQPKSGAAFSGSFTLRRVP